MSMDKAEKIEVRECWVLFGGQSQSIPSEVRSLDERDLFTDPGYEWVKVRELRPTTEAARVPPEVPTCPVCLNHRLVVTCPDCGVDLSEHISSLWDKKPAPEDAQSKPAEPLQQADNGCQPDRPILVVMHWLGIINSYAEGRRLIANGGVKIDSALVTSEDATVQPWHKVLKVGQHEWLIKNGPIAAVTKAPTPQPTDRLIEAAKAVYDESSVHSIMSQLPSKFIIALGREIEAIEAIENGGKGCV